MRYLYKYLLLVFMVITLVKLSAQAEKFSEDTYFIVLDVQEYYTHELLDSSDASNLIYNINSLLDKVDSEKVIYVRSMHKLLSISFKGIKVDTADGMEFDHRLKVVNDIDFVKSNPDAFTIDELNQSLIRNNVKNIVVVGLMAEYCVYKTLLGGIEKGYRMFVITDAIAGKSDKSKRKIIKKIEKKGISII